MLIEQAIFTSTQSDRLEGYQVAAASPGVTESLARELAAWGPAHDSLLHAGPNAGSVNFHGACDEHFCVSLTSVGELEYSGRGGGRIYTQMFLLTREALARFANNPFAVLKAAAAAGATEVHDELPSQLAPIRLAGRSAIVNGTDVAETIAVCGADPLALLIDALLTEQHVGLAAPLPVKKLLAAAINVLPPPLRLDLSFSSGLKYSARRPFRVIGLPGDRGSWRQLTRRARLQSLDLCNPPEKSRRELAPLARAIGAYLREKKWSSLARQYRNWQSDESLLTDADDWAERLEKASELAIAGG